MMDNHVIIGIGLLTVGAAIGWKASYYLTEIVRQLPGF